MNGLLRKVCEVWKILARDGQPVYMPVPIHSLLSAVQCVLAEEGYQVEFIPSDLDPAILPGMLIAKKVADKQVAQIYYSKGLTPDEQRYVIAKEIVHLLDERSVMTAPDENLKKLLEDLTTPSLPAGASAAMDAEDNALYGAIELLFPFEARMVLKASLAAKRIDSKTIAKAYAVPDWVAELALSDSYHTWIVGIRRKEGIALVNEERGN